MSKRTLATDTIDVPAISTGDSFGSWTEREAAAREWERQHEAEWVRIDRQLRGIATRRATLDAEEARLLRYAEELKLWRGWGFGSMCEYMERAMGYAPHTASERLRVARALGELPLIAEALEQGALLHSAVRELSRVAIPETEDAWLEAARGKNLREVEAMVSGHKPGDLPTDGTEPRLHRRTITLDISPETYDLWRRMHALAAEEHGQRLSDDELIQSLFRRAYGNDAAGACIGNHAAMDASDTVVIASTSVATADTDAALASTAAATAGADTATTDTATTVAPGPSRTRAVDSSTTGGDSASATSTDTTGVIGVPSISSAIGACRVPATFGVSSSPAYKIAIKQCPDCKRGWQYSGGRDVEIDPAVLECAACDAIHLGSLDAATPERATSTVTPRKREQVLARDGHCCTVPGCRRNIGLDLHHIEYRSHGGDHSLANLTTLCDLHHRAVHFEKLAIRGVAPDRLVFEFRKPRDRRNVTDDDAAPRSKAGLGPTDAVFGSRGIAESRT